MLAAAGIVVTEISTPTSAPDLAEVSESTPAAPAKQATMNEKASGLEMNWVSGLLDALEVGVDQAGRHADQGEQEGGGDPDREADRRARSASAGRRRGAARRSPRRGRRAGRTRARRPSRRRSGSASRVKIPTERDQAGEDHEGEEVAAELGRSPRCAPRPPPRRRRRRAAPARPARPRSAASEICESICSRAIEPSPGHAELLEVVDHDARVLAGDVAEDHVAPRAAARRPAR